MKKLIAAILAVLILGSGMGIGSDMSVAAKVTSDFIPTLINPVDIDIAGGTSVEGDLATNGNPKMGVQYFIVTQPAHGTLTPYGLSGNVLYTADSNSVYPELFTFKICRSVIKAKDMVEGVSCTSVQTGRIINSVAPVIPFNKLVLPVTDALNTNGIIRAATTNHFNEYFDNIDVLDGVDNYTVKFNNSPIITNDMNQTLNPDGIDGLVPLGSNGVSQIVYNGDSIIVPVNPTPTMRFTYMISPIGGGGIPTQDFTFPFEVYENGVLIEKGEIVLGALDSY